MKISEKILLHCFLFLIPVLSYGEIYAQSGYEEGKDGILLLTDGCPDSAGKADFKMAFIRVSGSVMQGCYVKNNRGNFVAKWQDGSVVEIPSHIFVIKENQKTGAQQASFSEMKEEVMSDYHNRTYTDLRAATSELDASYKKLISLLDINQKEKLKSIQEQWSTYKNQNCHLYASYAEGGSMQPLVLRSCLIEATNSRIKVLNKFVAAFSQ